MTYLSYTSCMFASNPRGRPSIIQSQAAWCSFILSIVFTGSSMLQWMGMAEPQSHTNDTRNWCILSHTLLLSVPNTFKNCLSGWCWVSLKRNWVWNWYLFSGLPQPGSDCGLRPHTFNIFASAAFIHRPYMQDTEIRYGLGPTSRETFCKKSLCCAQYTN